MSVANVDEALALLESGAPLVHEPNVRQFVNWRHGPRADQLVMVVPDENFHRAISQQRRIQARFNRELCALVPVKCKSCGETFIRPKITRVRRDACVAKRRDAPDDRGEVRS